MVDDDVHGGGGGGPAVQARIDPPSANFDGGMVAEIVRGFENQPSRIQRLLRLRFVGFRTGFLAEALACGAAEQDCVHCRYPPSTFCSIISAWQARVAAWCRDRRLPHACETDRIAGRCGMSER